MNRYYLATSSRGVSAPNFVTLCVAKTPSALKMVGLSAAERLNAES
jgi:hypothetical protein